MFIELKTNNQRVEEIFKEIEKAESTITDYAYSVHTIEMLRCENGETTLEIDIEDLKNKAKSVEEAFKSLFRHYEELNELGFLKYKSATPESDA